MKEFIAGLVGLALFASVQVSGQETHGQHGAQKPVAGEKGWKATKSGGMPCCDGMETMGGMKEGMPMKADMKAKMEKMKEMKAKMAEKMKRESSDGSGQNPESKSQDKPSSEPGQHQH